MYISPKVKISDICGKFSQYFCDHKYDSKKTLIVVDFNIRTDSVEYLYLSDVLEKYGFKMKLQKGLHSTNGQTQIDLLFANIDLSFASYYESVVSYHKPIFFAFKKAMPTLGDSLSN